MSLFKDKDKGKGDPLVMPKAPNAQPAVGVVQDQAAPPTTLEKLKLLRDFKSRELQRLNARVVELDAQIAWLERFPQVDEIIKSLRALENLQSR